VARVLSLYVKWKWLFSVDRDVSRNHLTHRLPQHAFDTGSEIGVEPGTWNSQPGVMGSTYDARGGMHIPHGSVATYRPQVGVHAESRRYPPGVAVTERGPQLYNMEWVSFLQGTD